MTGGGFTLCSLLAWLGWCPVVLAGVVAPVPVVVTLSGYLFDIVNNRPGVGRAALVSWLRFYPVVLPW